ncbi:hypothetical protein ARMGADRAFT_1084779 [Armillaria gallica]|uniref:Uncharacterized protein n=1 Tax=Armillaria gallica TaxID=47427 RepID=A0A2H3D239_ARMGA|nr:hypothetical protein ARMGADRAFT_1084779 [Armillaria gallica]
MAPTGCQGACTRAQGHGGRIESSAVTESEAPGPTETLAVHPEGALNARFHVQDLGINKPSQPNYSPQHGQQPPPPSPHVPTTPPSTHSHRHQGDLYDPDHENPFTSTLKHNASHLQPQLMLGSSLTSADDVEIFNFDTLSDSSGPTTPTPILHPCAPTPKSNRQHHWAK